MANYEKKHPGLLQVFWMMTQTPVFYQKPFKQPQNTPLPKIRTNNSYV